MDQAMLQRLLAHHRTRGLELDDPALTSRRREIIQQKEFLRRIYLEWYRLIGEEIVTGEKPIAEIGSGAGFMRDFIPGLITSDVQEIPGVDLTCSAYDLPFETAALRGIVMVNVLHHLGRPRDFFREAARCIRPAGVIVMIEPWNTPWSRLIYRRLHHEPFEPEATSWDFPLAGPLSGANGALPWILFQRDREIFERDIPEWQIRSIVPMMPFRYLLSGGVSLRSLMPGWSFGTWRRIENLLHPWMRMLGMFARIVLLRRERLEDEGVTR